MSRPLTLILLRWFKIEASVRQGYVLAPDSFATGMDWLLDRTVESCSIGVAFGQSSFTDLDFADDVSLLAARASCSHIGDNCK